VYLRAELHAILYTIRTKLCFARLIKNKIRILQEEEEEEMAILF